MSNNTIAEPTFALVDYEGGLLIEIFEKQRHLSDHGFSRCDVTLLDDEQAQQLMASNIIASTAAHQRLQQLNSQPPEIPSGTDLEEIKYA
jgi:hypothetical protein